MSVEGRRAPAKADCALPPTIAIDAGGPATPVTLIRIGERLPTVTVTVFTPAILPSVHAPIEVGEPADVVVGEFASVPPPAVTAIVIGTPPMVFPLPSFTEKVGADARGRPAVPVVILTSAEIEAGTAGSVPLEQPAITKAITTAKSRRVRVFM